MNCPFCSHPKTKVMETRTIEDGLGLRRTRKCQKCGKSFKTTEHVEPPEITVIKKDGTRVPFDRKKLIESMQKACSKRQINEATIRKTALDIENVLRESMSEEIQTSQIGEEVMVRLKELDQVAYVRFAAVYREFADLESLMGEIKSLLADKEGE